jgi:hypothetical protein
MQRIRLVSGRSTAMNTQKTSCARSAFRASVVGAALTVAAATAASPSVPVQVCLAPADVDIAAGDPTQAVEAVRATFSTFLTGPSLGVVPLTARLESQAREEARLAGCPYLLLTSLMHTRKSGGRLFSRLAAGAVREGAWSAAANATSATGRMAASAAAGAASEAAWASIMRSKDELTLAYWLESPDGAVLLKKTTGLAASSDGEDLLTPQVKEASEAIAAALLRVEGSIAPATSEARND